MRLIALSLALALASCAQWQKPGATAQDLDAAQKDCNAEALAKAPPQLGRTLEAGNGAMAPAYSCVPGRGCVATGMSTAPTAPDVMDVNAAPRTQAFEQCMTAGGWKR